MSSEVKSRHFGGAGNSFEIQIERAEGAFLYDDEGKKYIDLLGGSCVGNLGWGNEKIENSIKEANVPSYVSPNFYYKRWDDLAELLASITPGELNISYRTTGGSESIDAAMQIAMLYTGRKQFISVEGSYHGNTIGALSIGASANRKTIKNLLPDCHKIELPLNDRSLVRIEKLLRKKDVAAYIMEPIITSLGVIIPEDGFMERLGELCKKYGTLLVMDEVATGFGHTGKIFATEHYDIQPDIMCMAKGISGGYAALGAVVTTEEIANEVKDELNLYSTFGWHPISVEAAIASIEYLKNNKDGLFSNVAEISELIKETLEEFEFQQETEIRVKGFTIGIDVKDKDHANSIKEKALDNGLIISTEGTSIVFYPPLNIEKTVVKEALEILEKCI